ncbi:MAG: hypothetical protein ABEL51_03620 [Salinibacter sp.]
MCRKATWLLGSLLLFVALSGCTIYVADPDEMAAPPPSLEEAPPRLLSVEATPNRITSGERTKITFRIRYEDWNQDVGPETAELRRSIEKVAGSFRLAPSTKVLSVPVEPQGREGIVRYELYVEVPFGVEGRIRVTFALADNNSGWSDERAITLPIEVF